MAKAKDLRDQSVEELEAAYNDCCAELFELRNKRMLLKKLEKPLSYSPIVAGLLYSLTVIREKRTAKHWKLREYMEQPTRNNRKQKQGVVVSIKWKRLLSYP